MNVRIFYLILSALYFIDAKAEDNNIWVDIAKQDLVYIYETVKYNHPGYVDQENNYFKIWLEQGYEKGLKSAQEVASLSDVMNLLKTYVAGFADGHFGLDFNYAIKYKQWAGLIMEKQGDEYLVRFTDSDWSTTLPEISSKLISCDGREVDQIMEEDILTFRFNNQKLNFPKVWYALNLFVDDGIGKRQHFKHCVFEKKGKHLSLDIEWRRISAEKLAIKTNKNSKLRKFNIDEFENNSYWISLPTFVLNTQEKKNDLKQVIEQLKEVNHSTSLVVFDVRGNGGGSSAWGVEVAKALYGEPYINSARKRNPNNSYALWRASSDNYEYLNNKLLPYLEKQVGKESRRFRNISGLSQRMKQALLNGTKLVPQTSKKIKKNSSISLDISYGNQAAVVLLTDSNCFSACLDFADLLLKLPNVIHMGQETGADTVYMETRFLDLPSGLGGFSLAQKVYRNRLRKHNESYKPDYLFNGDIRDTEKVQNWLHDIVKNE